MMFVLSVSHRQAQAAVLEGIARLHQMNIATKRPDDYFAEMVKTDEHMKKVFSKFTLYSIQYFVIFWFHLLLLY